MTLSTNAKDYIASNLGRNDCFASSGIAYTDPRGDSHTGSTYNVVKTMKLGGTGPHGEWFDDIPDYRQITDSDIAWIGSNSYCVGVAPAPPTPPIIPPTQICTPNALHCYGGDVYRCSSDGGSRSKVEDCPDGCTNGVCDAVVGGCTRDSRRCNGDRIEECRAVVGQDNAWFDTGVVCKHGCTNGVCNTEPGEPGETVGETGPFEVTVGGSAKCSAGSPSVALDTSDAYAYFKAEPARYVGVMDIMVKHIHDSCYAYFAWEMRMWDGSGYKACPLDDPERQEISRFLAKVSPKKVITLKRIDANVTEMVSGSFEIPAHIVGKKTICLSLWGDYDYNKLVSDLAAEGYEKEIDW